MSQILALDLSSKSSGFALFDNIKLVDYGRFIDNNEDTFKRINSMNEQLTNFLIQHPSITTIVIEEVHIEKGIYNQTYKVLMYLQGKIMENLHNNFSKITTIFLYPSEWRTKCGIKQGAGVKRETLKERDVQFVKDNYSIDTNDDTADAICIGHAFVQQFLNELNWG